jgi:uncharacterized membrane protein YfcA
MDIEMNGITEEKIMGWEVSLEKEKLSIRERMSISSRDVKASIAGMLILCLVFALGCWLAGNPLDNIVRIQSAAVTAAGWKQSHWGIVWSVVALAVIFEFLDSAAGMGYGTAFTPLLLIMGYDPMQIVPVIMIQQACAGLISSYIHREFGNIEWRFKPMSETVKLWLIIAVTGSLAVVFSIFSVYAVFKLAKIWIKLYVCILLMAMAIISIIHAKRTLNYHPRKMLFFGALAGFNKGIGGGGYGPVVTIGGIMSGIPVKSMMAVTALSEGTVCVVSILVWFFLLNTGVKIDFILLPSMMLGSTIAVITAPYAVRVFPEKRWKFIVPVYCCIIAGVSFWKLGPSLIKVIFG